MLARAQMYNVDIKFAMPEDYKIALERCKAEFLKKERIHDKYFDTRGLDLLQAGAYLRDRNFELELKIPRTWHGDYKDYSGKTEFFVFKNEEVENILKERFKTGLQETEILCTMVFEREYWCYKECSIIIDTVFVAEHEFKIGEVKFLETVNTNVEIEKKAMEILDELGFETTTQSKLAAILKSQNSFAHLKLVSMTGS